MKFITKVTYFRVFNLILQPCKNPPKKFNQIVKLSNFYWKVGISTEIAANSGVERRREGPGRGVWILQLQSFFDLTGEGMKKNTAPVGQEDSPEGWRRRGWVGRGRWVWSVEWRKDFTFVLWNLLVAPNKDRGEESDSPQRVKKFIFSVQMFQQGPKFLYIFLI